jgi:hypothetical protein
MMHDDVVPSAVLQLRLDEGPKKSSRIAAFIMAMTSILTSFAYVTFSIYQLFGLGTPTNVSDWIQ